VKWSTNPEHSYSSGPQGWGWRNDHQAGSVLICSAFQAGVVNWFRVHLCVRRLFSARADQDLSVPHREQHSRAPHDHYPPWVGRVLRALLAHFQYIYYSLCTNTMNQAGLESGCAVSGNSGQRRSGGQGRRGLHNTETQCRTRAEERQIAGAFEEMQAYPTH
jgi:hypothetical protein